MVTMRLLFIAAAMLVVTAHAQKPSIQNGQYICRDDSECNATQSCYKYMCVDKLVGATLVGAQDPCAAIKCNDKANVCIAVAGRAACVPKPSQGDDTLPTLPPVVVCPPQTTYQASADGTVQCVPTDDTVQLTCASMRCMQGCCRVGRDGLPFCAACVSSPTDGLVATCDKVQCPKDFKCDASGGRVQCVFADATNPSGPAVPAPKPLTCAFVNCGEAGEQCVSNTVGSAVYCKPADSDGEIDATQDVRRCNNDVNSISVSSDALPCLKDEVCLNGVCQAIFTLPPAVTCATVRCSKGLTCKTDVYGRPNCVVTQCGGFVGLECSDGYTCQSSPVGCPKDLKICDDGSSVGRDPNNKCEFFKCQVVIPPSPPPPTPTPPTPIGCTKDLHICEDGFTSVGRDPYNNCEFRKCPVVIAPSPPPPPTPVPCTKDLHICEDGSSVGRDPYNNCEFRKCPTVVGMTCGGFMQFPTVCAKPYVCVYPEQDPTKPQISDLPGTCQQRTLPPVTEDPTLPTDMSCGGRRPNCQQSYSCVFPEPDPKNPGAEAVGTCVPDIRTTLPINPDSRRLLQKDIGAVAPPSTGGGNADEFGTCVPWTCGGFRVTPVACPAGYQCVVPKPLPGGPVIMDLGGTCQLVRPTCRTIRCIAGFECFDNGTEATCVSAVCVPPRKDGEVNITMIGRQCPLGFVCTGGKCAPVAVPSCAAIKCVVAGSVCKDTKGGPVCAPQTCGGLNDVVCEDGSNCITIPGTRPLAGGYCLPRNDILTCATVKCQQGYSCLATPKGAACVRKPCKGASDCDAPYKCTRDEAATCDTTTCPQYTKCVVEGTEAVCKIDVAVFPIQPAPGAQSCGGKRPDCKAGYMCVFNDMGTTKPVTGTVGICVVEPSLPVKPAPPSVGTGTKPVVGGWPTEPVKPGTKPPVPTTKPMLPTCATVKCGLNRCCVVKKDASLACVLCRDQGIGIIGRFGAATETDDVEVEVVKEKKPYYGVCTIDQALVPTVSPELLLTPEQMAAAVASAECVQNSDCEKVRPGTCCSYDQTELDSFLKCSAVACNRGSNGAGIVTPIFAVLVVLSSLLMAVLA